MATLTTTNVLLGILALLGLIEALAFLAIGVVGVVLIRRLLRAIGTIEREHLAPAASRVNAILDDLRNVTATVNDETRRVHRFVGWITGWMRRYAGVAHEHS